MRKVIRLSRLLATRLSIYRQYYKRRAREGRNRSLIGSYNSPSGDRGRTGPGNECVCVCGIGGGGYFFLTPLSDDFSPLSLRRVLQQRVFNSTRKVFSLSSFFSMSSVFYFSQPEQESGGATLDIPAPQLTPPPLPSLSLRGDRRRDGKRKVVFFKDLIQAKKIGKKSHSQIYQQYYRRVSHFSGLKVFFFFVGKNILFLHP